MRGKRLSCSSLRIDLHIDVNLIIAVQEHKHPLRFMHHCAINELRRSRPIKLVRFLPTLAVGHETETTSWRRVKVSTAVLMVEPRLNFLWNLL